jgi:hypothetical protein
MFWRGEVKDLRCVEDVDFFFPFPRREMLVLVLLLCFALSKGEPSCGLACFLSSLVVDLPDFHDTGRLLLKDYTVSLTQLQCQDFRIQEFDSAVPSNTSVFVGVKNLVFFCSGVWNAKWFLSDHGTVSGTGEGSFETLSLLVSNATSGLAISVNMTRLVFVFFF